jgi:hypothetical protein
MDKYLEKLKPFLEKNVEWIVLGLAALFVVAAAYQYIITPPVSAEVDGTAFGPGSVDRQVAQTKGEQLKAAIANPSRLNLEVADFADVLDQRLTGAATDVPTLDPLASINFVPTEFTPPTPDVFITGEDGEPNIEGITLPTPPPAEITQAYSGKARIDLAAADAESNEQDTSWVTVTFDVNPQDIRAAWFRASVPPASVETMFLRVDLLRQEKLPGGSWGDPVSVPVPEVIQLPPLPQNPEQEDLYRRYAQANQPTIVTPDFYTLVSGDDPLVPPAEDEEEFAREDDDDEDILGDIDPFDPRLDLNSLTAEQRQAVMKARREGSPEDDQPGGDYPGDFPGMGGFPGEGFDNNGLGDDIPADDWQNRGSRRGNRGGPGAGGEGDSSIFNPEFDPSLYFPGEGGYYGGPEEGRGQRERDAAEGNVNRGLFDPVNGNVGIIKGWAFDNTAEPGKTYRYKIVYTLLNPLYQYEPLAAAGEEQEKLTQVFGLRSDEVAAEWSEPVEVSPLSYVYLADDMGRSGNPSFVVFRWQQGGWNSEEFDDIAVGDVIGGVVDEIDFTTEWILGDIREHQDRTRSAVIVSRDGRIQTRGNDDLNDDLREELEDEVEFDAGTAAR